MFVLWLGLYGIVHECPTVIKLWQLLRTGLLKLWVRCLWLLIFNSNIVQLVQGCLSRWSRADRAIYRRKMRIINLICRIKLMLQFLLHALVYLVQGWLGGADAIPRASQCLQLLLNILQNDTLLLLALIVDNCLLCAQFLSLIKFGSCGVDASRGLWNHGHLLVTVLIMLGVIDSHTL